MEVTGRNREFVELLEKRKAHGNQMPRGECELTSLNGMVESM